MPDPQLSQNELEGTALLEQSGMLLRIKKTLLLAFADREMEECFLRQYRDEMAASIRWGAPLTAALFLFFMWQDSIISAEGYRATYIRIFGALPACLLFWFMSRNLRIRHYFSYVCSFFCLVFTCFTTAMLLVFEPGQFGLTSTVGLSSFLLVLYVVFSFSGLLFLPSVLVGLLILFIYAASVGIWTGANFGHFLFGDFLMACAFFLGGSAKSLFEERQRRQRFELSVRLEFESERYKELLFTFRNIMDHMPVAVGWIRPDRTFEYLNNFFVERFGYAKDKIPNLDTWFKEAYPDPEYRLKITSIREETIAAVLNGSGDFPHYEAEVTCNDGNIRKLMICHQMAGDRCIDILVDITDRELLQTQLIKIQKLNSISVMATGVAHNFNNVLTVVLGYISFALRHIDPSNKGHQCLLNAEAATHRAAGIGKQLLDFAKVDEPVTRPVLLLPLVINAMKLATAGSCVETTIELPPDLGHIRGDSGQISQVFYCLMLNSVQAMPNGGMLTVSGYNESVDHGNSIGLAPGNYIRLAFEDQGCGIPEEDQKQIFVPYFTTRAEIGKGMGLATAHAIITRHGGAINFCSEAGSTTFTLHLPADG